MKQQRKYILFFVQDIGLEFNKTLLEDGFNYTIEHNTSEAMELLYKHVNKMPIMASHIPCNVNTITLTTNYKTSERSFQVLRRTIQRTQAFNPGVSTIIAHTTNEQLRYYTMNFQTLRLNSL